MTSLKNTIHFFFHLVMNSFLYYIFSFIYYLYLFVYLFVNVCIYYLTFIFLLLVWASCQTTLESVKCSKSVHFSY